MNTNKIKKVAVLIFIIGLIMIQILSPKVNATGVDNLNELFGEQIGDNNNALNNETTEELNNVANTNTNNANTNTNNANTNITNTTALPKTGANENIVIALMVICAISGVYAYKKIKEYNM